jgi:molybdopterin-guanine dinucleotide biosynthesis protein A
MNVDLSGYVLTGGASSRMGREKATLALGGKTLVERAVSVLKVVAGEVLTVGGNEVAGVPAIPDLAGGGPKKGKASIFGLQAALVHARTEWAAVLACDLPFVTADLFGLLTSVARSSGDHVEAVVPMQPDGKLQPLAAIYRPGACLKAIEAMIAGGDMRLHELVGRVDSKVVLPRTFAGLDPDGLLFFNINTPADYGAAKNLLQQSGEI